MGRWGSGGLPSRPGVEDPSGFSAAGLHLVDSHIHLEEVEGGAEAAMAEARAAGVTDVVAMGVDAQTSRQAVSWSGSIPGVWAAVGHHPLNQEGPDIGLLRELAANPRVVAIG